MVGTYNSGLAGSWKRLGPFTKTVSDGDLQIRFQSNDVALVSGLEIWNSVGTQPTTPPFTESFYRAINLGGPAMTMDGHNWEANVTATPNFVINETRQSSRRQVTGIPGFVFNPRWIHPSMPVCCESSQEPNDLQFTLTSVSDRRL